jgi:DNA polymerase-3 subunit delta'
MLFSEVIGHANLKANMIRNAKSGAIPHAQLFLGQSGSGALPLALAYAQYLHCENPGDNDACGQCASCNKSRQLIHPDTHFTFPFITNPDVKKKSDEKPVSADWMGHWRKFLDVNAYPDVYDWMEAMSVENKQLNITSAECAEIIKHSNLKSFESKYKIFIIWMPEYLDKEGNKLLKLLEEPPADTIFLLVAEDEKSILATILSRTQLTRIPPLAENEIAEALLKQGIPANQANQVARLSEGNYRLAQDLLHTNDFGFEQLLIDWWGIILQNRKGDFVAFADQFSKMGREKQKYLIIGAISLLRQALMLQQMRQPSALWNEQEQAVCTALAQRLQLKQFDRIVSLLTKLHGYVERNGNTKLLGLNSCIHIARMIHGN